MQVVLHLGAPCTDGGLLVKSLLKNRKILAGRGIIAPPTSRYRAVVRDTSRALKGRPAAEDVQEALLDTIIDEPEVTRLILSDPRFICINRLVVQGAQIWPMIERQTTQLRALFPDDEVTFFIGMRDPATLIPALFRASRFSDFEEFTANMQPRALRWSEMLRRLRIAQPDCQIVTWCNEDTPLLWGPIMRRMAGLAADVPLDGLDDLVETIMDPAGFRRLQSYLSQTPPKTDAQRRRIVAAFLDRYARDDEIEETVDLPGWSQDLIAEISQSYDADLTEIRTLSGVTLLEP